MAPLPVSDHWPLVGDDVRVPVLSGGTRRFVDLDTAATSAAAPSVAQAVADALPWYSSVHRGAGAKSRLTSARYEEARETVLDLVHADPRTHVAVFPRNTTEALNLLAFRLQLSPADVVVTTSVEHHANFLPWRRHATLRTVDVDARGIFSVEDVVAALDVSPRPRVLALTGASNVTGWVPPLAEIAAAARARGVLVVVDAAQLAPHRPIDMTALGVDVVALSGHKMYAPFGAGALVAPRALFADGEPMLVGGGAVSAVSEDDVVWAQGPDREEAGSPNVLGVLALAAAAVDLTAQGWSGVLAHERALVEMLDLELATVPGLERHGPGPGIDRVPVAAFTLAGRHHGLVAARLSAEFAIGVRSGCFCAHPYMARLLRLSPAAVAAFHADVRAGRQDAVPGAVRASANRGTRLSDVAELGRALRVIAATPEEDRRYVLSPDGQWEPRDGADLPWSAPRGIVHGVPTARRGGLG